LLETKSALTVPEKMVTDDWTPLPALWPEPAASRTIGQYEVLVFTQEGVADVGNSL
jgi:hypothetical protein